MAARAQTRLVLACAAILLLAGCAPSPAPDPDPDDSPPSASPTPSPPAVTVLDEDVLLAIAATATAANGSVLQLNLQVHRALAWDDPAAASLAELMTSGCEGSLDASVYEANLWSFLEIDINANPTDGTATWPSDKRINLFPIHSDDLALASSGAIVTNDDVDSATPYCARDRFLNGPGESMLVAGLQGDTDEAGAAGQFTRWANHDYGFVGREVAGQSAAEAGITISDCEFVVTAAGKALNGGATWWHQLVNESVCTIGGAP